MSESRTLHLLGATGAVRTEMVGNKEYLVVPVVALMEGVIHAVNAETPEFVPLDTLKQAAESWNGRPVTLGHPKRDGKQCSAQDPGILASHGLGTIRNARVEGKKMLMEALIESSRAKKLHPDMYARLADGASEEVSVGAMVVTDKVPGRFGPKPYLGSWTFAQGDHLAFLPGGRGACSVEMGCGTHRAAMRMCEDTMKLERNAADTADPEEQAELIAYNTMRTAWDACDKQWDSISALIDDLIAAETGDEATETDDEEAAEEQVESAQIESIRATCQSMMGALQGIISLTYGSALGDAPRYMSGARHNVADTKAIQAVHDHAMALGANCDRANYKLMEGKLADGDVKLKVAKLNDPTTNYIEQVRQRAAK